MESKTTVDGAPRGYAITLVDFFESIIGGCIEKPSIEYLVKDDGIKMIIKSGDVEIYSKEPISILEQRRCIEEFLQDAICEKLKDHLNEFYKSVTKYHNK